MVAAQQLCARNSARRAQPAAVRTHTCVLAVSSEMIFCFRGKEKESTPISKVDG